MGTIDGRKAYQTMHNRGAKSPKQTPPRPIKRGSVECGRVMYAARHGDKEGRKQAQARLRAADLEVPPPDAA